ncbi:PqqD family protein [Hungatella sp. SB206]|uniref:PqqD family protein n=1 Tax=Hungatella sp. SB206 TaxID=2937758 RepID=UPI003DA95BC4
MLYTKRESLSWAFNENKVTIKDEASGFFFPLNDVGSLIWDMIDGVNEKEDIIQEITRCFAVTKDVAERDVEEMINSMLEYDLIESVNP